MHAQRGCDELREGDGEGVVDSENVPHAQSEGERDSDGAVVQRLVLNCEPLGVPEVLCGVTPPLI